MLKKDLILQNERLKDNCYLSDRRVDLLIEEITGFKNKEKLTSVIMFVLSITIIILII